uniref:Galaxin-like repeats domain-containing protein n=1 Tax=Octopus bimaculoides TaxID=37653 RepID=A0A0L8FU16_OCTBM
MMQRTLIIFTFLLFVAAVQSFAPWYICGNQIYDPHTQFCCNNIVHQKTNSDNACCNNAPYNAWYKACCAGQLIPWWKSECCIRHWWWPHEHLVC